MRQLSPILNRLVNESRKRTRELRKEAMKAIMENPDDESDRFTPISIQSVLPQRAPVPRFTDITPTTISTVLHSSTVPTQQYLPHTFIVGPIESLRGRRSIVCDLKEAFGKNKVKLDLSAMDGGEDGGWMACRVGEAMVHVMSAEALEYYKLGDLLASKGDEPVGLDQVINGPAYPRSIIGNPNKRPFPE